MNLLQVSQVNLCQDLVNRTIKAIGPTQTQDFDISRFSTGPSIERFHGVLAIIDISGFTHLSSILSSQELKYHINRYFTLMISIVTSWDGDVVKFAGDSVFILWRAGAKPPPSPRATGTTSANSTTVEGELHTNDIPNLSLLSSIKPVSFSSSDVRETGISNSAVDKALSCLMEVHRKCDNYEIMYYNRTSSSIKVSEMTDAYNLSRFYTLTIHSGLSVGIIGGCDVGVDVRMEYLLVGDTVKDATLAVNKAAHGTIVVTRAIRDIFYGRSDINSICDMSPRKDRFLFSDLGNGFCVANQELPSAVAPNSIVVSTIAQPLTQDALLNQCVVSSVPSATSGGASSAGVLLDSTIKVLLDYLGHPEIEPSSTERGDVDTKVTFNASVIREALHHTADIHSHEAYRLLGSDLGVHGFGEIRPVATMFVNIIDSEGLRLLQTSRPKSNSDSKFHDNLAETSEVGESLPDRLRACLGFVRRHPEEEQADLMILKRLQHYFVAIDTQLRANGGQMRQFILDDKGLVCIGSVGLRGSVTESISESCLSAAIDICKYFRTTGCSDATVNIGVTLGKVFCGLVGSPSHNEYAILGRSVNLAARLMGSAAGKLKSTGTDELNASGGCFIFCDAAVHDRNDGKFVFSSEQSIFLKGYTGPVRVYQVDGETLMHTNSDCSIFSSSTSLFSFEDEDDHISMITDSDLNGSWSSETICPIESLAAVMPKNYPRVSELRSCFEFLKNAPSTAAQNAKNKLLVVQGLPKAGKTVMLELMMQTLRRHLDMSVVTGNFYFAVETKASTARVMRLFSVWRVVFTDITHFIAAALGVGSTDLFASVTDIFGSLRASAQDREELALAIEYLYGGENARHVCAGGGPTGIGSKPLPDGAKVLKASSMFYKLFVSMAERVQGLRIIICVDDAQWIDLPSWNLLLKILRTVPGVQLIFGCSSNHNIEQQESSEAEHDDNRTETKWFIVDLSEQFSSLTKDTQVSSKFVFLETLDVDMTQHYVVHMLRGHEWPSKQLKDQVVDSLVAYSKGHPTTLYQIASAIKHHGVDEVFRHCSLANSRPQMSINVLTFHLSDMILYQFDKLTSIWQAILKAATVLSLTGALITPRSVFAVLSDRSSDPNSWRSIAATPLSRLQVARCLGELSMRRLFLEPLEIHSKGMPFHVDAAIDENLQSNIYIFRSTTEKDVIYNLMTSRQTRGYHSAAAIFLISQDARDISSNKLLSHHLIGEHFFRSDNYRDGILWTYKVAKALEEQGYVQQCYAVLQSCCRAFHNLLETELGIILQAGEVSHSLPQPCGLYLSNEDVRKLCDGRQDVLEAMVMSLTALGRCSWTLSMSNDKRGYNEALSIMRALNQVSSMSTSEGIQDVTHEGKDASGIRENHHFVMENTASLCALLSGIVFAMITSTSSASNADFSLVELQMQTAKANGQAVHILKAHTNMQHALHGLGRNDELYRITASPPIQYDFDKHHHDLITLYGADRYLQGLGFCLQHLVYDGKADAGHPYLRFIQTTLLKVNHVMSNANSVSVLVATLAALQDYDTLFEMFYRYVSMTGGAGFNLFKDTNPVVIAWLTRLSLHFSHGNEISSFLAKFGYIHSVGSLVSKEAFEAVDASSISFLCEDCELNFSSPPYHILRSCGMGLETMLAEINLIRSWNSLKSILCGEDGNQIHQSSENHASYFGGNVKPTKQARLFCNSGLKCLEIWGKILASQKPLQDHTRLIADLNHYWAEAQLLMMSALLDRVDGGDVCSKADSMDKATSLLQDCHLVTSDRGMLTGVAITSFYLDQLHYLRKNIDVNTPYECLMKLSTRWKSVSLGGFLKFQ